MSPGNPFILGPKGQKSRLRVTNIAGVGLFTVVNCAPLFQVVSLPESQLGIKYDAVHRTLY